MDGATLFNFLRGWILACLGATTQVIASHQDAPAPLGVYYVIDSMGTWSPVGIPSHKILGRPDLASPRVVTYSGQVRLWVVNADYADGLQSLIASLDTQAVLDMFKPSGASVLKCVGPTEMPDLQASQWRHAYLLILNMLWAQADSGETGVIESVAINDEIFTAP